MGISRACRDSAKVRSSPVGSVSPTVANAWSSHTNSRSRQIRSGCAVIFGMRWMTARWKSSFNITPTARAARVQTDREVERQHMARFEEFLERRQRPRFARFRRTGVGASRGQERPVNGRLSSKARERQRCPSVIDDRRRLSSFSSHA